MTIRECIRKKGWQVEVDNLKRYQTVDVDFVNADGMEDETQFDICGAGTKDGIKELEELFSDFCRADNFETNTVTGVIIVASAETKEELEEE